MTKIIGFGFTSPQTVVSNLSKASIKFECFYDKNLLYHTQTKVILFTSTKDLVTYQKFLIKEKCIHLNKIFIVFDAAIKLIDIENIMILDGELKNYIIFKTNKDQDYIKVILEMLNKDIILGPQPIVYLNKSKIIEELIHFNMQNKVLNFYNNFIYSLPAKKARKAYKLAVYRYLFGKITLDELKQECSFKRKISKSKHAFDLIVLFFESKFGKKFIEVLKSVDDATNFDEISEKNGIDAYELRYFYKSWNTQVKFESSREEKFNS